MLAVPWVAAAAPVATGVPIVEELSETSSQNEVVEVGSESGKWRTAAESLFEGEATGACYCLGPSAVKVHPAWLCREY